jgi:uncharacterized membrane protein YdbT with pleckstrin-like domain
VKTLDPVDDAAIYAIERPHARLWTYYLITSVAAGPGLPILLLIRYFRFHSLRYRFDEQGVSMSWGVLFRRQINLTYARIQDIHLSSNIVERWLGLARIQVQTASGNAGAEMTIEGIREFESLRDFLYAHMRGTKGSTVAMPVAAAAGADARDPRADELAALLREVANEVRELRLALAAKAGPGDA